MDQISYDDFARIDVRVGRVVQVEEFPQARKPAYKLRIDFGPAIGVKNSSAQITSTTSRKISSESWCSGSSISRPVKSPRFFRKS